MKDELFRVAVMAFALALVTPGCGDGEDLPPVDLGPEDDMNVPVDLDLDRDMGPPPCDGPPGLYVEGSCTELAAGVRPFRPRFQLWSDAAEKERFVFIPENGVIDTSDPDRWLFPVGTVFWKTFSRGGVRLETRILTKVAAGEGMDSWTFQTYGWNQTQDDVTLVGVDGLSNVWAAVPRVVLMESVCGSMFEPPYCASDSGVGSEWSMRRSARNRTCPTMDRGIRFVRSVRPSSRRRPISVQVQSQPGSRSS